MSRPCFLQSQVLQSSCATHAFVKKEASLPALPWFVRALFASTDRHALQRSDTNSDEGRQRLVGHWWRSVERFRGNRWRPFPLECLWRKISPGIDPVLHFVPYDADGCWRVSGLHWHANRMEACEAPHPPEVPRHYARVAPCHHFLPLCGCNLGGGIHRGGHYLVRKR